MAGGAANVAANIVSLGAKAVLLGAIGNDSDGAALRRFLSAAGIRDHCLVDESRQTTAKTRFVANAQQILRADKEQCTSISADVEAVIVHQLRVLIPQCDVIAVSDYAKGLLTDRVLCELISAGRLLNKPVVIDPKRSNFGAYRGASLIKPNLPELRRATGNSCRSEQDIEQAASAVIRQIGADVLVTRGADGMSFFTKGQPPVHVRALAREVYDVSGAGDSALAALVVSLGAGQAPPEAVRVANLAASVAITKQGTAQVTWDELALAATDGVFFELEDRIVTRGKASTLCRLWKEKGMKVGFTNGCFDILHAGHVSLLKRASRLCDRLIVGLNSDASVRRLKGPSRPVQSESSRAQVLCALNAIDAVVIFDEDTPQQLIEAIVPTILFKGSDYTEKDVVGAGFVKQHGGEVVLIDLLPGYSTTAAVRRASNGQGGQPVAA